MEATAVRLKYAIILSLVSAAAYVMIKKAVKDALDEHDNEERKHQYRII